MTTYKPVIEYVNWQKLHRAVASIACRILREKEEFDTIIAIVKGGLIPARLLSDVLGIDEIGFIGVKLYKGVGEKEKTPKLTIPPTPPPTNKRILVVDDIVDTGTTLQLVIDELNRYTPAKIRSAAIYVKPWAIIRPDYYYETTSKWIVFPWERGESIREGIFLDEASIGIDSETYNYIGKCMGNL